jgi:hypothetical protein
MVQGMQALCALAASPPAGRAGSPSRAAQELRLVLSGGADGCLHVWDAAAGAHLFRRRVFRTSPSSFGVAQLCADRSGRFVACGDATGMLKMYDASVLAARPAPEALVKVCAWRAHERALISVEMLHTTSEHLLGGSAVITVPAPPAAPPPWLRLSGRGARGAGRAGDGLADADLDARGQPHRDLRTRRLGPFSPAVRPAPPARRPRPGARARARARGGGD